MSRLNYKQLYYFWHVARSGSVTRAAEQLHLTPQTVSGQVAELELSLGVALFNRVGRRLALTAAGRQALEQAGAIFSLGADLEHTLRHVSQELTMGGDRRLRAPHPGVRAAGARHGAGHPAAAGVP